AALSRRRRYKNARGRGCRELDVEGVGIGVDARGVDKLEHRREPAGSAGRGQEVDREIAVAVEQKDRGLPVTGEDRSKGARLEEGKVLRTRNASQCDRVSGQEATVRRGGTVDADCGELRAVVEPSAREFGVTGVKREQC